MFTTGLNQIALAGALLPALAKCHTQNGLTWTDNAIRMNHMQVVGSHNSYHIMAPPEEIDTQKTILEDTVNYWYSHPQLDTQLGEQKLRNVEIDVIADPAGGHYAKPLIRKKANLPYPDWPALQKPGTKVFHIPDADIHSTCITLIECLEVIKSWMDKHPASVPIPIMMEFKTDGGIEGGVDIIPWDDQKLLAGLDDEIRSVFGPDQLLTPDDVRRGNMTLEQSIIKYGWPDLDSARGRIFFLMDNGPDHVVRYAYNKDKPNLEGRVLFTNSAPGNSDCAFQKLNEPTSESAVTNIQDQVRAGYWVRTRADEPMKTVLDNCNTTQREAAFRSGAHIVSTDFQAYGMSARWGCDYAVRLDGNKGARCNPVNGPAECDDETGLEPERYRVE